MGFDLGKFKKKAGERLAQRIAVRLLSKYEDRLDEAVEGDYRLLERTAKYRPALIKKAKTFGIENRSFVDDLEPSDVLDLMEDTNPGLYTEIVSEEDKRMWAERELRSIINFLK